MSSTAEISEVQGTVLRVRQMIVRDTPMTQAVIKTGNDHAGDLITCMWKSGNTPVRVVENSRYTFRGQLRNVDTRRIMIEPTYQLIAAPAATAAPAASASAQFAPSAPLPVGSAPASTGPKATSKPKSRLKSKFTPAFITKLSNKQLVIGGAVVAVVVIMAIIIPLSLASSDDTKQTTKTALKAAVPTPIEELPQAFDAAGKAIPPTPEDCEVVTVPFSIIEKNDPAMPMGKVELRPAGVNGQDRLCYVHGRGQFPVTAHLKKVVNQFKYTGIKR